MPVPRRPTPFLHRHTCKESVALYGSLQDGGKRDRLCDETGRLGVQRSGGCVTQVQTETTGLPHEGEASDSGRIGEGIRKKDPDDRETKAGRKRTDLSGFGILRKHIETNAKRTLVFANEKGGERGIDNQIQNRLQRRESRQDSTIETES
ncbi:hypothetical protein LEP1GSC021_5074 [Leptospira noguchii str. 1993005606]|nr:hypothetical protein LEP1GSC021_5074 [Leptospira noguchii str. 1993005606]